jgi:hypothetical protein
MKLKNQEPRKSALKAIEGTQRSSKKYKSSAHVKEEKVKEYRKKDDERIARQFSGESKKERTKAAREGSKQYEKKASTTEKVKSSSKHLPKKQEVKKRRIKAGSPSWHQI